DHYYNAVKGVTDNLIIWDCARTDFSHRFEEIPPIGPELSIASENPAAENEPVDVDIVFNARGSSAAATSFSVDYDENCLFFDDIDFDPVDGIFDNVAVHVPGDFTVTMFHDLGDSDGEIDISIVDLSPPIATLPDGPLVTITSTATCAPAVPGHVDADVLFSADPAASFSDDAAQDIDGTTVDGSVRIYPGPRGDCNFNGSVTVADLVADALEIFDGDGSLWGEVPGGTFAGSPVGCDANADTEVTAGDVSCAVRLIFGDTCGSQAQGAPTLAGPGPTLEIDGTPRLEPGSVVPVHLIKNGHDVTVVAFSLEIDLDHLEFDPADDGEDGMPDVSFPLGEPELVYLAFEADGEIGKLDVMLANLSGLPLLDGLLEVELAAEGWVASWIRFSLDPPPSFGGADGRDIAGTWVVTGAELFTDGFESGDLDAWSSSSP
ncbi:MAG: hypothetical protein GY856_36600, partial [bacterium]|nr:hypothetical protein [bacterium]